MKLHERIVTKSYKCRYIRRINVDPGKTEKSIKRKLSKLGERLFFKLMDIKTADNLAQDPKFLRVDKFERIRNIAREIILRNDCISLKDLEINGRDINAMGYSPSNKTGECLEYLLDMLYI